MSEAPTPSIAASPEPTAAAIDVAAIKSHASAAQADLLELAESTTEGNLVLVFSGMSAWAEDELAWLDTLPEAACIEDFADEWRAAARATKVLGDAATAAITTNDGFAMEGLSEQSYEIGAAVGSATTSSSQISCP